MKGSVGLLVKGKEPQMPDHFLFWWMSDPEAWKGVAPAIIAVIGVATTAIVTARNVSKTIKNTNYGTPPELLKAEKWLDVLEGAGKQFSPWSKDYLLIKNSYISGVRSAVLESRLESLGINDELVNKRLAKVPIRDYSNISELNFPKPEKYFTKFGKTVRTFLAILICILIVVIVLLFIADIVLLFAGGVSEVVIINITTLLLVSLSITWCLVKYMYSRNGDMDIVEDVVFRNIYQHESELYTMSDLPVKESVDEFKRRVKFMNSKNFRKWYQESNCTSSWGYGFDVGGRKNFNDSLYYPNGWMLQDRGKRKFLQRRYKAVKNKDFSAS